MSTIRYSFRPSLFASPRTLVLDDGGIVIQIDGKPDRRVAWGEVAAVHIEPATGGDDGRARWLINLKVRGGRPIQVDSVNVRGTQDFEHKTDEFAALLGAVHERLRGRTGVRFLFGARRGIITAWRIALMMIAATGVFAVVAAIVTEDYESVLYGGLFFLTGASGLAMLKGRTGPRRYDPTGSPLEADGAKPQTGN